VLCEDCGSPVLFECREPVPEAPLRCPDCSHRSAVFLALSTALRLRLITVSSRDEMETGRDADGAINDLLAELIELADEIAADVGFQASD
jgi:hypothetical protein